MKIIIRVLIISLFLISCGNSKNEDENQIKTFNLKELPKITDVKLSDLGFADIEYIPLQTNGQCLISEIDNIFFNDYNINKIIVCNDYYLIKNSKRILKFRNDGSFVTTIGTIGRGPNEFTHIGDLDIDKENKNVYIISSWQNKLCVYSEYGEFIRTFNIPFYSYEFRFVEGRILCYCGNNSGINENSFVLMDTCGQIIKNFSNIYPFKKIKNNPSGSTHENLFYRYNNRIFKKEVYSDTVYVFESMSFKPHLIIDVGERLITPKARSEFDAFYIGENFIDPMNLFEFGDYVYYQFIYKFKLPDDVLIYGFIGSKKNDFRALIGLGEGLTNDLDGGPNILPLTTKDDNTIIALIDALKFKNHVNSEAFINSKPKYPEMKKDLEKLANSLKETDNPVLVLVKLKK
jgi:hypothetical protein